MKKKDHSRYHLAVHYSNCRFFCLEIFRVHCYQPKKENTFILKPVLLIEDVQNELRPKTNSYSGTVWFRMVSKMIRL